MELRDERHPGVIGVGEGYPDRFYGETPDTMAAMFPHLLAAIGEPAMTPAGLVVAAAAASDAIRWNGAAKCALDIALHDLAGKVQGVPVHEMIGLSSAIPRPTSPSASTSPRSSPSARLGPRTSRLSRSSAAGRTISRRSGRSGTCSPVRSASTRNTGWTRDDAERLLPELVDLGVELIEQPFPARAYRDLGWIQERSTLPIVADESAVTLEDLEPLVGVVAGVNVKLAKCGGIAPAREMLERARELGFRTFLGCMEETSVGIAGSAAVASLADWVDLDGCLLLADDPFEGLTLGDDHRWILPGRPGLGLTRRAA